MLTFYVEMFDSVEKYKNFIEYMLSHSDYFSFIYFKHREGEKNKKSVETIKTLLKPYKIYSKVTNKWPGTVSLNENNHIYKFFLYKADIGAKTALNKVGQIFEWNYPEYPMDLCFYKDGYAWFSSCAHERLNWLYIREEEQNVVTQLERIGAQITYSKCIDDDSLFFLD